MEPNSSSVPSFLSDRLLVWNAASFSSANSSHSHIPPDHSPDQRRSSSQRSTSSWAPRQEQHPLLAKLLEMEEAEEDIKHSEYMAHVLIQREVRDYAYAVEDALLLLKNGSRQILQDIAYWREPHPEEATPASWLSFAATNRNNSNDLELSQVGGMVVKMSSAVKRLQDEDALAFWTSDQREVILKLIVGLSKDLVKMRRKLARIRDCLGDRVRNVRRVAIKCECEISGNIVPTEIYFQWVQEDAKIYKETYSNAENIFEKPEKVSKKDKLASALKKTAKTLAACVIGDGAISPPPRTASSASVESDDSLSIHSHSTGISAPAHTKVYEIRKDIEFLRPSPSTPFQEDDDSICDKSIESFVAQAKREPGRNEGPEPPPRHPDGETEAGDTIELDEVWSAKPSQKYLELIATNMVPQKKFHTNEFVFDHHESRIKEASIITADEEEATPTTSNRDEDKKILTPTMMKEIEDIKHLNQDLHAIVTKAMWAVRGVESGWLAPASRTGCRAKMKELFHILDFIVDTAKLTQNPALSSRMYPEDMHEIKSVLDPLLKELTNAYMAVGVLHNVVQVDAHYLKELVGGFPKGSLILREWLSDVSIDVELTEIEKQIQGGNSPEFLVDVEELFA